MKVRTGNEYMSTRVVYLDSSAMAAVIVVMTGIYLRFASILFTYSSIFALLR